MKTKTNHDILLHIKAVKKILLIMKLTLFLIIMTVLQVSATSIFSQGKNISVDMQNVTVRDVIIEIETQGDMSFFYNDDLTELDSQVSVSFQDKPIKDVLEDALTQADMTYEVIKDNFVVLIAAPGISAAKAETANVSGQITDEAGNPLPGANITVKGSGFQINLMRSLFFFNVKGKILFVSLYSLIINHQFYSWLCPPLYSNPIHI